MASSDFIVGERTLFQRLLPTKTRTWSWTRFLPKWKEPNAHWPNLTPPNYRPFHPINHHVATPTTAPSDLEPVSHLPQYRTASDADLHISPSSRALACSGEPPRLVDTMYHLAKGIYRYVTSKEEYSVILLGLDNAGKTTFHEQVKSLFIPGAAEPKLKTVPTVGQNVSTIPLADMYLKLWDVGGQMSLRNLWQSYYASCHAIVFIIDSTDIGDGSLENSGGNDRLDECRLVLEDVLQHSETEGVPLLILANKQDREDCVETIRIKEGLVKKVMEGDKGSSVRDSRVLAMSALTGDGVREAIDWVRTRVQWNKESRPPVMR